MTFALVIALTATPKAETLRVWLDCSTSMSASDLSLLVPQLLNTIYDHAEIDRVEIVRFSCADVRTESSPAVAFDLGNRPLKEAPKKTGGISDWVTAGVIAADNDAVSDYQMRLGTYVHARRAVLDTVGQSILEKPSAAPTCTTFDDFAWRLAEENRPFNVVLTDGWIDCSLKPIQLPRMVGKVLFVLIPKNGDPLNGALPLFLQRKTDMQRLLPNAEIVRPYLIGPKLGELLSAGK